jgi:hypothetical protein
MDYPKLSATAVKEAEDNGRQVEFRVKGPYLEWHGLNAGF